MRYALAILVLCLPLAAAPILVPPDLERDGIPVPLDDPRIGQLVYARPLWTYTIYFNDNPGPDFGDHDYNDAVIRVQFDSQLGATAYWVTSLAGWTNTVTVENQTVSAAAPGPAPLGTFSLDEILKYSLNPQYADGNQLWYHQGGINTLVEWTRLDDPPDGRTPEPGTWALLAGGLVALALIRKK
jgi:hypothetical protein